MTKKIWKIKPETIDFIVNVCPTKTKAFELIHKALVIFNCEQTSATLTIAKMSEIFGASATITLWRSNAAELVEVSDRYKEPWELTAEEIGQIDEDEDEDDEDDSADEHDGILNCVVIVKHGSDDDDEAVEDKKDNE